MTCLSTHWESENEKVLAQQENILVLNVLFVQALHASI